MTNTEIIQAIRNEIERLKTVQLKRIQEGDLVDAEPYDKNEAYNELLDFLDTLEEKPVDFDKAWEEYGKSKGGGAITVNVKDLARHFYDLGCRRTAEKYDEIEYNRQRAEESEKPMNLEEEINRYLREECSDDDEPGIHEIAEHFAKWGVEHLADARKTSPNDLEDAANNYLDGVYGKMPHSDLHIAIFIAGAEWDRSQIMREAVEGEICIPNVWVEHKEGKELVVRAEISKELGFKFGDKVRVIVLPKES